MKKLLKTALSLVLATSFLLTSCNKAEDVKAKEKVAVVGIATDLATLDPANAYEVYAVMMFYPMYDNLFKLVGENMSTPEPCLVDSYEVDGTSTTYTFKLKDNLKFASGNALTSKDVKWSFDRVKNLKSNASFQAEGVVSIETPDDKTVIVKLSEPDASFFAKLAGNAFCVLDSELLKKNGGDDSENASTQDKAREYLDKNSAGSGPYKLVSWTPNTELVLERNDNYWGEKAKLDRIIVKEIPDPNTQVQMLKAGEIDVAFSINANHTAPLENDSNIEVYAKSSAVISFLMMNNDETIGGPLADSKVQQAIRLAIDYEGLKLLCGQGTLLPMANVPKGFVGALEREQGQDIDKAKELLAEAGYENGFEAVFTVANYDSEGMPWSIMAQKIQSDLAKIGVVLKIETAEIGVVIENYRAGKSKFLIMHWSPDYFELNNQLAFIPGNNVGLRANWKATDNQQLVDLANQIKGNLDQASREKQSQQMQQILAQESPFAFLLQHPKVFAASTKLKNIEYNDMCKLQLSVLDMAD